MGGTSVSSLLRPSSLGNWATCAKKARYIASNPHKETGRGRIATWVGSAVHQRLADPSEVVDRPPPGTLYDTTSPNVATANVQVNDIVSKFHELMEIHGLRVIGSEVEVESWDGSSGTLDMVIRPDVDDVLMIGDLKTGKRIPSGAWLQLGAYFRMTHGDHDFQKRFGYLSSVVVIHIPRTPINEVQSGSLETRLGHFCAEQSKLVEYSVLELIEGDKDISSFPASPGVPCASCPMSTEDCPVKIVNQK